MNPWPDGPSLIEHLAQVRPPGRTLQHLGASELSYGRHSGPPEVDAHVAAVLVLLYPEPTGWLIPLTVRPETLRHHAGQVCLPGGRCRADESPAAAALREVREELGVGGHELSLVAPLSPLYLFHSNHWVQPWTAVAHQRPQFCCNPGEVLRLVELPVQHLMDEHALGRCGLVRGGVEFQAPCVWYEGIAIWGATAMILMELRHMLRTLF